MCSQNTAKIAKGHTFLIKIIKKIRGLESKEIASHQNSIDKVIEVLKEFSEINRNTKNLISRMLNHLLSILVNLLLAIRYGPSLRFRSGPNIMVLVKGLPTYTWNIKLQQNSNRKKLQWLVEELKANKENTTIMIIFQTNKAHIRSLRASDRISSICSIC